MKLIVKKMVAAVTKNDWTKIKILDFTLPIEYFSNIFAFMRFQKKISILDQNILIDKAILFDVDLRTFS